MSAIRHCFFFLVLFAASCFPAVEWKGFFSPIELEIIEKGKDVELAYKAVEVPESLFLPAAVAARDFHYLTIVKGRMSAPGAKLLDAANLLLKISKMNGITYYSVTRGKRGELLKQSHTIVDTTSLSRRPDMQLDSLQRETSIYFCQEFRNTGPVYYRGVLQSMDDGSLLFSVQNTKPIVRFKVFRVEPNGEFRYIRIFPDRDGFLFYVALRTSIPKLLPHRSTAKESFLNRARAFIEFYRANL